MTDPLDVDALTAGFAAHLAAVHARMRAVGLDPDNPTRRSTNLGQRIATHLGLTTPVGTSHTPPPSVSHSPAQAGRATRRATRLGLTPPDVPHTPGGTSRTPATKEPIDTTEGP